MKNKPATTADYQRRINIVVEYIRTHLDETLDLRTLAEVSSFSPCHFHRIVSAFLGEPPGEFIARTRIETAARLLLYSDLTVAEIAYRVGYDAPSSLTKAFGRFFGISPKEYRTAKNLPSMTTRMHSDAGIRLSKPKMLEIPEKTVAYLRAQGDYGEVDLRRLFRPALAIRQRAETLLGGDRVHRRLPQRSRHFEIRRPAVRRMPDDSQRPGGRRPRGRQDDRRRPLCDVRPYGSLCRIGRRLSQNLSGVAAPKRLRTV